MVPDALSKHVDGKNTWMSSRLSVSEEVNMLWTMLLQL